MQVNFAQQNFFPVMRTFGEHAAKGIAEERPSPEFETFSGYGISADVASLKADAIHHANINAVRNGMRSLDGAPGIVLGRAELGFLRGMPSDRRRVKKNVRSLQRREPRAFGIPLVPADQRAESSSRSIESLEAKISGSVRTITRN